MTTKAEKIMELTLLTAVVHTGFIPGGLNDVSRKVITDMCTRLGLQAPSPGEDAGDVFKRIQDKYFEIVEEGS